MNKNGTVKPRVHTVNEFYRMSTRLHGKESLPARHQRHCHRAQIQSSRRSRLPKLTGCEKVASRMYERPSIEQPVEVVRVLHFVQLTAT